MSVPHMRAMYAVAFYSRESRKTQPTIVENVIAIDAVQAITKAKKNIGEPFYTANKLFPGEVTPLGFET